MPRALAARVLHDVGHIIGVVETAFFMLGPLPAGRGFDPVSRVNSRIPGTTRGDGASSLAGRR